MSIETMKTQKFALILGLLMLSTLVFGQKDYTFKVLAAKGSNEVKSGGGTWAPLKTGASLKTDDEVKLGENSYVGLVHVSGKPVEVKLAGVHKVSELANKVGGSSSVLNKYTDFILSSNSAESKKNRLSATGAVHRAVEAAPIQLMLPENQHSGIYSNVAVINWASSKVPGPYVVTLRNMFDDELAKFETPENSMQVDLNDPRFANENAILVEVSSKQDAKQASKQHLIKKLTPAEQEKVKFSLSEIMGDISEQNALNKFLLAGFFEQQNLFIDAIAAYEESIKLAPDVDSYKEGYEEFLLRHGLKKQ
jgi:hypothetical protein